MFNILFPILAVDSTGKETKMDGPSIEEAKLIANENGFGISEEEFPAFWNFIEDIVDSYKRLDELEELPIPLKYPRGPGRKPALEENPLGGWAWLCEISGGKDGPLSGKKIAIKDNVSVAGIPLSNGSKIMEGFIPNVDATIVTRILDAGGKIEGKAMCEDMCMSGCSDTSQPWPVKNPSKAEYMAGGSSSGSAALVAAKVVDMAIGGDQAGSIRIPSSWCGTYGLKPTWGLVPYTGIIPIEFGIDHAGPMANSVFDLALLLEAIAGRDNVDPRQVNTPFQLPSYTKSLQDEIKGIKIGIVEEGFNWTGVSEKDVDSLVENAVWGFENLGAKVSKLSIPMHKNGVHIWTGIATEGAWSTVFRDNGITMGTGGYYDSRLIEFFASSKRQSPLNIANTLKVLTIVSEYVNGKYCGKYYVKAQNLRRKLSNSYDEALKKVDLLVMPTTVQKAQPLKLGDVTYSFRTAMNTLLNTCPFDVTGHPALNVPSGLSNGLPVGMMLIAKHFAEETLLKAAKAFELAPLS